MRLGFYTDYSADIAQFAQTTGFTSMELSAWPQSALNADEITDERIKEIRVDLDDRDIQISALGYYPNYLAADKDEAAEYKRYFRKVMQLAARMEVPAVCTFAGMTPGLTVERCMDPWADLFSDFCVEAEDLGIKIAIENCPMLQGAHRREPGLQPRDLAGHVRGRPLHRPRPGDRPVAPGVPRHRPHPGDLRLR